MAPIICFIGWHNSGKTTLTSRVVALLKAQGYKVAVIKSTKETGIASEAPYTDTAIHWHAGADCVTLVAPDQLLLRSRQPCPDLHTLAHRYCGEVDLVVAEGFKHAAGVPKIEVRRDAATPLLRDQVDHVIAVATDLPGVDGLVFGLDQTEDIARFVVDRLLDPIPQAELTNISLHIDGTGFPCPEIPESLRNRLKEIVQELITAGALPGSATTLDLAIRLKRPPQQIEHAHNTGHRSTPWRQP